MNSLLTVHALPPPPAPPCIPQVMLTMLTMIMLTMLTMMTMTRLIMIILTMLTMITMTMLTVIMLMINIIDHYHIYEHKVVLMVTVTILKLPQHFSFRRNSQSVTLYYLPLRASLPYQGFPSHPHRHIIVMFGLVNIGVNIAIRPKPNRAKKIVPTFHF